jgi:hypothetical protein
MATEKGGRMQKFDVIVAGEINPDLILSDPDLTVGFGQQEALVESAALTIGSSSAIFACGAARLGLKVAFIGVVGDPRLATSEKGLEVLNANIERIKSILCHLHGLNNE